MFGSEILDIILGLIFVYLLLSVVCSGVNEYIAALTNRRGKMLLKGIETLLKDAGLADQVMGHRIIDGLKRESGKLPSYIPARSFAIALLDTLGYQPGTGGRVVKGGPGGASAAAAPERGDKASQPSPRDRLHGLISLLQQDAMGDVVQFAPDSEMLKHADMPEAVRNAVASAADGARTEYQKLHDSVEVWFNNGMDRVSGAYKRRTQVILLVIATAVSLATNADTLVLWRKIASSEAVRAGLVSQAQAYAAHVAESDTPRAIPLDLDTARARFKQSVFDLRGTGLQFGWAEDDLAPLGLAGAPVGSGWQTLGSWLAKLVGLALTVIALSLGAPFWFDMLNKVVNLRNAGRAPNEMPKKPEAPGKRAAELPTK